METNFQRDSRSSVSCWQEKLALQKANLWGGGGLYIWEYTVVAWQQPETTTIFCFSLPKPFTSRHCLLSPLPRSQGTHCYFTYHKALLNTMWLTGFSELTWDVRNRKPCGTYAVYYAVFTDGGWHRTYGEVALDRSRGCTSLKSDACGLAFPPCRVNISRCVFTWRWPNSSNEAHIYEIGLRGWRNHFSSTTSLSQSSWLKC